MIHVLPEGGSLTRVVTHRVQDVVVVALACATDAHAEAVRRAVDDRLLFRNFDLSGAVTAAPAPAVQDMFAKGKPVSVLVYADDGEHSIDAVSLGRTSKTHVRVRSRMGVERVVHQGDLRTRRPG